MVQDTSDAPQHHSNNPFADTSGVVTEPQHVNSVSTLGSNNPFDQDLGVVSDSEKDPLSTAPETYFDLESNVFKTCNRLMDDIKADLLFFLDPETGEVKSDGLLKAFPVTYSDRVASIKHNPYELYTLNQESSYAPFVEHKHSLFNKRDKITVIRALLFDSSQPSLAKSKVYHVKIQIKVKESSLGLNVSKNEFHLVDSLHKQDAKDLLPGELADNSDRKVKDSLPVIIDEANYVCSLTGKIMRIEISKPEFDEEDLHDYEIGPINVRYSKALQTYEDLNPEIPSPATCLNTLFKAIRGPLLLTPQDEQKTINCSNKSLNSHINPKILTRRLLFEIENNEFIPPNVSDLENPNHVVVREAYIRKISEISFLGTKAYSANQPNQFKAFQFTKAADTVFHQLHDNASIRLHEFLKQSDYINISAYPFYSDDLIINCYHKTVYTDPSNGPVYFDSIKEIGQQRATYKLSSFVSKLISLNVVGQKEIDSAYKALTIEPSQASLIDDDLLLTMYKREREEHPLDGKLRNSLKVIADHRKSGSLQRYLNYEPLPNSQAYDLLDIDENVDDDIVSTAFMIKSADNPSELKTYNRALVTIATERRSFKLLDRVENEFKDLYPQLTFEEACEFLGVDKNAGDFQIINIFQMGNREIRQSRNALKTIAKEKNSNIINSYLATGLIDHNFLPADEWPVGLNNIGNTCYLNSLLQYYFSIKPLRDAVLNFEEVYNGEDIYNNRRIGGRLVGEAEVERSFQFSYRLRDLFSELIHSKNRDITPEKELAYLAFMPVGDEIVFDYTNGSPEVIEIEDYHRSSQVAPEPAKASLTDSKSADDLIDLSASAEKVSDDDIVVIEKDNAMDIDTTPKQPPSAFEFEVIDGKTPDISVDDLLDSAERRLRQESNQDASGKPDELQESKKQANTVVKEAKGVPISDIQPETAFEIGRQQDVTECIGNVLLQIEASMKPEGAYEDDGEQIDMVKRLFYGETVQHLTDVNDPSIKRDKIERFSAVFVNILDKPRNIYEAFDLVYKTEAVDNSSLVRAERIRKLPIILQVQIQRVYFNRETFSVYKNIEQLAFPETLYMDRYFDTEDEDIIKRRKDVDQWKEEIKSLNDRRAKLLSKNEHGITFKDSLKTTKEWLVENQLAKEDTIKVLDEQISKIDQELITIFQKIQDLENKMDHHFDGFQKHGYSIFAIFIHRGEANYGHYWIYIRDQKRSIYRKYNDEIVSEVTEKEVFNFNQGNSATPYFLGYVKNGHEHEIEPLCRDIESKAK